MDHETDGDASGLLRLATAGSVDDGKSTLIGRLLHDSKMIYEDHLEAISRDSKKVGTTGDDIDLALLVDGLQAEREPVHDAPRHEVRDDAGDDARARALGRVPGGGEQDRLADPGLAEDDDETAVGGERADDAVERRLAPHHPRPPAVRSR